MTENKIKEAKELLEDCSEFLGGNLNHEEEKLLNEIGKYLGELEQYRAIGTVEDIKALSSMEIHNFNALQKYRAIGTIEDFKALKEKNEAKKPIFKFEYEDGRQFYDCPVCGAYVMHAGVQSKEKYCSNCGQKLDWSE